MSDNCYLEYTLHELERFLRSDTTNFKQYISEYFDCDDFSQVLAGKVKEAMMGIPFGVIWYFGYRNGRKWGHAVNVFFDASSNRLLLIEPQSDVVYKFKKDEWKAKLIMI